MTPTPHFLKPQLYTSRRQHHTPPYSEQMSFQNTFKWVQRNSSRIQSLCGKYKNNLCDNSHSHNSFMKRHNTNSFLSSEKRYGNTKNANEFVKLLFQGNRDWCQDKGNKFETNVENVLTSQSPSCTLLSCCDSRIPSKSSFVACFVARSCFFVFFFTFYTDFVLIFFFGKSQISIFCVFFVFMHGIAKRKKK